jgi:hypothetical protein
VSTERDANAFWYLSHRARQIVELAAQQTKDPYARSWLLADEVERTCRVRLGLDCAS